MKGFDRIYDSEGGTILEVTFFCPIRQFIRNGEGVGPFPSIIIQAFLFSYVVNLISLSSQLFRADFNLLSHAILQTAIKSAFKLFTVVAVPQVFNVVLVEFADFSSHIIDFRLNIGSQISNFGSHITDFSSDLINAFVDSTLEVFSLPS
ncbi:MAG: hypothetical protein OXP71_03665 [Candidatus Poribacteria bacterium]|nr:hypothetical protein [Candidatus Poribacteria bacterium]